MLKTMRRAGLALVRKINNNRDTIFYCTMAGFAGLGLGTSQLMDLNTIAKVTAQSTSLVFVPAIITCREWARGASWFINQPENFLDNYHRRVYLSRAAAAVTVGAFSVPLTFAAICAYTQKMPHISHFTIPALACLVGYAASRPAEGVKNALGIWYRELFNHPCRPEIIGGPGTSAPRLQRK